MKQHNLSIFSSNIIKRIIAVFVTIALIVGFVNFYNRVTFTGGTTYTLYYDLPKDSIDVAFIGTSHVFCGVNPVVLWDEYNIRAYDVASGMQPIWASYAYLEETLKKQSPELVVFDVYLMAFDNTPEEYDQYTRLALIGIKPSLSKYNVMRHVYDNIENVSYKDRRDYFWDFPLNHTKYNELEMNMMKRDSSYHLDKILGYSYTDEVVVADAEYDYHPELCTQSKPCSALQEMYLRKAIELCQSKNTEILLTNTFTTATYDERTKVYNYIRDIASEYGVEFVNGCQYAKEIGIDGTTDYMDDGNHLNYSGATKYTKWLTDNYILRYNISRRTVDDPKSRMWNDASKALGEKVIGSEIKKKENLYELKDYLDNLEGIKYILVDNKDTMYTVVAENSEPIGEFLNEERYNCVYDFGLHTARISSDSSKVMVELDSKEELCVEPGQIGVVAYGNSCRQFVACTVIE